MAMQGARGTRATFERGAYVRLSGVKYESYDGEIGRVYGDLAPVKGEPAYGVEMMDGMLIAALQKDLTVAENPKEKRGKNQEEEA